MRRSRTEAISQRVLIDILRARLDELLPEPLARVQEREARQRRQIVALLRHPRVSKTRKILRMARITFAYRARTKQRSALDSDFTINDSNDAAVIAGEMEVRGCALC